MANASGVQVLTATTLVTTAETIAATSSAVAESEAGAAAQGVKVSGVLNVTAGTGTTAVTVRVRAGTTLSGALIGNAVVHTLAAAALANIPFEAIDPTLIQAGAQYVVTVQQTAATANGSVNQATISTEPISALPG